MSFLIKNEELRMKNSCLLTVYPSSSTFRCLMLLFIGSIFLVGCKEATRNIQSYYLPLEEIKDGMVYEYQAVNNDSLAPFYWYFRLMEKTERKILTSTYYDHTFTIQQLSNEEVVSTGVILDDLFLYATDTITGVQQQNPVRVEWDNAFPFEVTDSTQAYLYKIYWTEIENPTQKVRIIRNRHFMGDATYSYKGKEMDCVRFLVKEVIEVEEEGFQELSFLGTELYAKNLGLIYYNKTVDGQLVQEYELVDRFSMEELERRYYNNR